MEKTFWLPVLACLVAALAGCGKEKENFSHADEFAASKHVFEIFKRGCNDTYQYAVSESWGSPGYTSNISTTITVDRGHVVKRECEYYAEVDGESGGGSWTEDKDQLGSHPMGADPVTLDRVYAKAKEWLMVKEAVNHDFAANNSGMISMCGYVINESIGGRYYKESIFVTEIKPWNP